MLMATLSAPQPGVDYQCLPDGNCVPLNSGTQAVFSGLQAQINRVRRLVGILGDIRVDGVIGSGTVAKLMKVAQKVGERVRYIDDTLETYAIVPGPGVPLPTTAQVAHDAADLMAALARNGGDYAHATPDLQSSSTLDPYMSDTTNQGGGTPVPVRPTIPTLVVSVGPTRMPSPTATTGPMFPPLTVPVKPAKKPLSTGAKIAIGVGAAGLLAALGIGAAAIARH